MISAKNRNLLGLAQAAAANSEHRYRLGAVIVSGNRVMGVGWNKSRNTPRNVSRDHLNQCTVHAEVDALRGLAPLRRATCYVARIDAAGDPSLARPCNECWTALVDAGVTKVYWTIDSNKVGFEKIESR